MEKAILETESKGSDTTQFKQDLQALHEWLAVLHSQYRSLEKQKAEYKGTVGDSSTKDEEERIVEERVTLLEESPISPK